MPRVKNVYEPNEAPPGLAEQTDARIRERMRIEGAVPPDPRAVFAPLMTALGAQAAPAPAAQPAALVNDTELFQQTLRHFFNVGVANINDLQTMNAMLANAALTIVAPADPLYGALSPVELEARFRSAARPVVQGVLDTWYGRISRPSDEIVSLYADLGVLMSTETPTDFNSLGTAYLAARPRPATYKTTLSDQEKQELKAALLNIDAVTRAYKGAGSFDPSGEVPSHWYTNPEIEPEPADSDDVKTSLIATKAVPAAAERIRKALRAIVNVTSPEVLRSMPIPRFFVTKKKGRDSNIRANAERGSAIINIGEEETVETIAHETGHVFENFLPLGCWLDLMRLLQTRHAAAGGGALIAIYPGHKDPAVAREAAFRAAMPAYPAMFPGQDHYPAKVYGASCPTEVFSTTLELLVTSKGTGCLLDRDPQCAAIVLRWLLGGAAIVGAGRSLYVNMALPSQLTL
jgi:hypothetical protein